MRRKRLPRVLLAVALSVALGVALSVALAGCAGGSAVTSATTPAPSSGSVQAQHVVYAVGDDAGGTDNSVSKRLAGLVPLPSEGLELFVYLGDVFPGGTEAAFLDYDAIWGQAGRDLRTKTASMVGNLDTGARAAGWIPYWSGGLVTPWPGSLTQTDPPYYAVKLGDWKFIILDTNSPLDEGSVQYGFLVAQLEEPGYKCIVCGHAPRWSNGSHGDADGLDAAWKAMCDHGALAYLSGHDHGSQIQPRRDRDGNEVSGDGAGGVVQIVAGAGGDTLYSFVSGPGHATAAWGDDTHYALLRLTLREAELVCEFIGADGALLHSETFAAPSSA
jgi:hypothetical protein